MYRVIIFGLPRGLSTAPHAALSHFLFTSNRLRHLLIISPLRMRVVSRTVNSQTTCRLVLYYVLFFRDLQCYIRCECSTEYESGSRLLLNDTTRLGYLTKQNVLRRINYYIWRVLQRITLFTHRCSVCALHPGGSRIMFTIRQPLCELHPIDCATKPKAPVKV
jgi:hypothetical protein